MSVVAATMTEVVRGSRSSSPGLSSPPKTPDSPKRDLATLQVQNPNAFGSRNVHDDVGDAVKVDQVESGGAKSQITAKDAAPAPPKRVRKKKEPTIKSTDANGLNSSTTATEVKVPKPRKPRAAPGTSTAAPRKKLKVEGSGSRMAVRQSEITNSVRLSSASLPPPDLDVRGITLPPAQKGNNEAIPNPTFPLGMGQQTPQPPFQVSRPSSGQHYDPIRHMNVDSQSQTPSNIFNVSFAPAKLSNHASASPSIPSMIEPAHGTPLQAYPFPPPVKSDGEPGGSNSISPNKAQTSTPIAMHTRHPSIASPPPPFGNFPNTTGPQTVPDDSTLMQIDTEPTLPICKPIVDPDQAFPSSSRSTAMVKKSSSTSTGLSSSTASPKPGRSKEASLPLPSGNGLLSGTMFGASYDTSGPEKTAPTVVLHIPLDGRDNRYINFAQMAAKQYGFDALYPRLAMQRDRLARVAAAGAALENAHKSTKGSGSGMSADEMSVDLSDVEGEGDNSNVEMSGMGLNGLPVHGEGEGSESATKPKKKRVMKDDQYELDDPFIDDTEMAWEEQAAASKDGFFVYSGPLIAEGEKANIERYVFTYRKTWHIEPIERLTIYHRAEGGAKRGRGRGRGTTRGTSTARGGNNAAKTTTNGAKTTSTRGGTTAVRKPRVTKEAKAQLDQERMEREKMAVLAAKPTSYPS